MTYQRKLTEYEVEQQSAIIDSLTAERDTLRDVCQMLQGRKRITMSEVAFGQLEGNIYLKCYPDKTVGIITQKELTAEIATLKGEVGRLKKENRRRAACDLVNDQFRRSIENHEEREGRLEDELAALRSRLDALVAAGEEMVKRADRIYLGENFEYIEADGSSIVENFRTAKSSFRLALDNAKGGE